MKAWIEVIVTRVIIGDMEYPACMRGLTCTPKNDLPLFTTATRAREWDIVYSSASTAVCVYAQQQNTIAIIALAQIQR